jgi:sugar lactone lactonase YvrE
MGKPAISPVVWDPPPIPVRARTKASSPPPPEPLLIPVGAVGPEDVAVDDQGRIFTGVEDGRILCVSADGARVDTVADVGGRPLGLALHPDGSLIVCNAFLGLQRVDPDRGGVEPLATEVHGGPIHYADNPAVAPNGSVFFSDSSQRFDHHHWRADIFEHSGTGRLLLWEPNGRVQMVLGGLQFANGVVVAPDQSFVAVAETGAYRITRLWLSGERAGQRDTLIDNLPGFPDNLSWGDDGLIWVALPNPRNPLLDRAHRLHPMVRRLVWALPEWMQPQPVKTMWAMAVDAEGRVVHDLQRRHGSHSFVTGVCRRDGKVYLGSLVSSTIAVLEV